MPCTTRTPVTCPRVGRDRPSAATDTIDSLNRPRERRLIRPPATPHCVIVIDMPTTTPIAVIANHPDLDSQALLTAAAAHWRAAGVKVVGAIAENQPAGEICDADYMRDIVSGKRIHVRLDTPPAGTTCHMDRAAMNDTGASLLSQIPGADVVVLSKFGKLETMQKGLFPALVAALASGKPVLTTVSDKHAAAWRAFAPQADWLDGDAAAIERWWRRVAPALPE